MVAASGQQRLQALGDVHPAQAEVTGWKAPSRIAPRKSVEPGVSVSGLLVAALKLMVKHFVRGT